jgi:GH24 family phage-related lysozyme (muramidase)
MNRKPIFDAVRKMLGRGFTNAEVKQLDKACDFAEASLGASSSGRNIPSTSEDGGRSIGAAGLKLIHSFEGCEKRQADGTFAAYPDPGSRDGTPWTIGWGSTGPGIQKGVVWTQKQCDDRFKVDIQKYANAVAKALDGSPTTPNQFDALVSFHYNTGAIRRATLTKLHKQGKFADAEAQFGRWVKNDGTVMRGLVRRRKAEADLYAKP